LQDLLRPLLLLLLLRNPLAVGVQTGPGSSCCLLLRTQAA
jgi:hypothetical protein